MERILDLARKQSDQAEVYRVWRRDTPASFEANRLKLLQTKETSGIALRLVKNGRIGLSATNDPNDGDGLVERALEISQFGAVAKFDLPGKAQYPSVRLYDEAVERVTIEQMAELGQSMIDTVRRANADLLCDARVARTVATVEVMNSHGGHATYKKSIFSLGVDGTLIRGTDMLFVGDQAAKGSPVFHTKPITDTVLEQLERARDTVPAPSGKVAVVFSPHGVASALLGPLTVGFNGRTVLQGASPLVGKLGQKLWDERFSLWDDPTIDLAPGSQSSDDEGVPASRKALIDKGHCVAFLYDLQTAGLAGATSTGSAARSLASLPYPATSLLVVSPGDTANNDIISGIKDGLLVEQLLGAGQGNVLGGEFGGNVLLGFRIQNGRVVGRVKDTVISGNAHDVLNKIVAIGKEPQWVGGSLYTPPICCEGVTVSAKA